jgi:hypothetical protein
MPSTRDIRVAKAALAKGAEATHGEGWLAAIGAIITPEDDDSSHN